MVTKLEKINISGTTATPHYYTGMFEYDNARVLTLIHMDEGMVNVSHTCGTVYTNENHIKDHLGNVRVAFSPGSTYPNQINDYYPFGLISSSQSSGTNKYLYNGKELQDDSFGDAKLEWYDYGSRFYDPQIGRFTTVDPLTEKYYVWAPFQYVRDNPIIRFDDNGMSDYIVNKETGEVKLMNKNDQPDRILKTREFGIQKGDIKYKKKGEAKVAVGAIERGFLRDRMNLMSIDNVIKINGEGQPTTEGSQYFALKLSNYIDKEFGGFYYSNNGSDDLSYIMPVGYKENASQHTNNVGNLAKADPDLVGKVEIQVSYHKDLSCVSDASRLYPSGIVNPDEGHLHSKEGHLKRQPTMQFIIITNPSGSNNAEAIPY